MEGFSFLGHERVRQTRGPRIFMLGRSYGNGWRSRRRNTSDEGHVCIVSPRDPIINTRLPRIFNFISCCFLSPRPLSPLSSLMSAPPSPSESAAEELILKIRAAHGFDNEQSAQDPAVLELRGKLERALER